MANLWEINTTEWMYTKSELDILFSAVEPKKWADDNYVTDAEKIKLANTDWVNSWNETHTTIWTLYKSASEQTTIDNLNLFWVVGDVLWATLNKITWANIKVVLKSYFDTLTTTLTNKRITKRVVTVVQSETPIINTDNGDIFTITWLEQAITSFTTNLTWTPVDWDMMIINITDNWTARAINWWASFEASTIVLPTTTVISTLLKVWFQYNWATSKWRIIATC